MRLYTLLYQIVARMVILHFPKALDCLLRAIYTNRNTGLLQIGLDALKDICLSEKEEIPIKLNNDYFIPKIMYKLYRMCFTYSSGEIQKFLKDLSKYSDEPVLQTFKDEMTDSNSQVIESIFDSITSLFILCHNCSLTF